MKLTRFLVLLFGLTLGAASAKAAYTGSYWTTGVSEAGGWYDANKVDAFDGDADDNMCYAASASNLIAWWQNGEAGSQLPSDAPTDLNAIWQSFIDANQEWDEGGEALAAINWWISGIYTPESREDAEGWDRYYVQSENWGGDLLSVTLRGFDGYYYDQYGLKQNHLSDFLVDTVFLGTPISQFEFADALNEGCGVSLAIKKPSEGDGEVMGHAITLWGVEYNEEGTLTNIWITDSDDLVEALVKVSVTVDEENDKIWLGSDYCGGAGFYIDGVYIVDAQNTLKWPLYRMQAYVAQQINTRTRNGRAGAALLPQVYLNATTAQSTAQLAANEAPEQSGALATIMAAVDAGSVTDSDAAAIAGASTAVLGQALSDDMDRQLRAMRNRAAMGSYSADAVAPDGKGGCPELPGKFFAWVNAEGNRAEQNADRTAAGYTLSSWGGTVGAGMEVDSKLSFGLALTAMYGDLKSDGPDRLTGNMDTAYLSAFARYQSGSWSHSFIGALGTMDGDYKRTAMGYSNYGDMEGSAFGFMYELSREFTLCDSCSISPVLNVAYRHTAVDAYSERGTDAALNVGKQSLDTVTLALGARYAAKVGQQALNRTCAFQARALVKYDFGDTRTDTTVGFVDYATRAGIESAERGALGLELGAGISIPVGTGSIFTDGALELRSDYTNFNATVGYRIQF